MSRGGNYFLPLDAQKTHAYTQAAMEKRGAILLPPHFFSAPPVKNPAALACRTCEKIIISYTGKGQVG